MIGKENCNRDFTSSISTDNLRTQGLDVAENKQDSITDSERNKTMADMWEPRDTVVTSLSNKTSQATQQGNNFIVSTEEAENNACLEIPQLKDDHLCVRVASLNIRKKPGRP